MSLLTEAYLLDKYGPLLTVAHVGEVLHIDEKTVQNRLYSGTLGIAPVGRRPPMFRAGDVAVWIDGLKDALAR